MKFRDYSFGSTILGKGVSSIVYKAKKEKSKKTYAIKCINQEFLNNQYTRSLVQNQIQALTNLKHHQNIIELIQFGNFQNNYYIVTEICEKGSLADKLQNGKTLSEVEAIYIVKQLIKAYKSLYSNHYIHRDIKPANILITVQNQIRLCDFGFAINTLNQNIRQNQKAGTPFYMAPESLKFKIYNYKSDFWAIGVTFYKMLTGELPIKQFDSQTQLKNMIQQSLNSNLLKDINFYAKQFLRLTLTANPGDRISPNDLFEFKFQRLNKSLQFSDNNLKKVRQLKTDRIYKVKDQTKRTQITKTSQSQENISLISESKNIQNKKKLQKILRIKQNKNQNNILVRLSRTQNQQNLHLQIKKQKNEQDKQKIKPKELKNKEICHFNSLKGKKNIENCRIIQALLSQFNLIRFVNRMIYRIQKFLSKQTEVIKNLQNFIIKKLSQLKNLENLSQQDAKTLKQDQSFDKWILLIDQYTLKQNQKNKDIKKQFTANKYLHDQSSVELINETIKKYYFSFNPTDNKKMSSQILVTIDFLISLKLLLEMQATKNYEKFYFRSRINEILELKFPKEVSNQHLEQITKKLMSINFF